MFRILVKLSVVASFWLMTLLWPMSSQAACLRCSAYATTEDGGCEFIEADGFASCSKNVCSGNCIFRPRYVCPELPCWLSETVK